MKKTTQLVCDCCKRSFSKESRFLKHKRDRGDKHTFCGQKCVGAFQSLLKSKTFLCQQCNTPFVRTTSTSKSKSGFLFCSQSCSAKWNNTHKTKGTRVSKLEVWLSQKLPALYPNIEFRFNRKDAIDSELDIFIPSLKLAFELNGIFHYEPIYGQEKLSSIQSNDNRKFQACLERGIELCIIDVTPFKNFKEQKAKAYLDIIKSIIDLKCGSEAGIEPVPLVMSQRG